jgi:hypothetical protein
MKQILIFLVLMTMGCNDALKYPLVVEKVKFCKGCAKYKYVVFLEPEVVVENGGYFYTNTLYQVGDTLK